MDRVNLNLNEGLQRSVPHGDCMPLTEGIGHTLLNLRVDFKPHSITLQVLEEFSMINGAVYTENSTKNNQ